MNGCAAYQEIIDEMTGEILEESPAFETQSTDEGTGRFYIRDREQMNWAGRKLDALCREAATINSATEAEIEKLRIIAGRRIEALSMQAGFFRALIAEYHSAEIANGGPKTIETPYVVSKSRKSQDSVEYDETTLLAWLTENGLAGDDSPLVRVKREPVKSEVKRAALAKELPATAPVKVIHGEPKIHVKAASEV